MAHNDYGHETEPSQYSEMPKAHSPVPLRPDLKYSTMSEETIRATATPPIDIPSAPSHESVVLDEQENAQSLVDHYMRTRNTSISFDPEVKTDSGHRQSMQEPLEKPKKERVRGRSLLQAMSEQTAKDRARAHSESARTHYDAVTGVHLPAYSTSPPKEAPHVGEGRWPILQTTVDQMARESQEQVPRLSSFASASTVSPDGTEARTPQDSEKYPSYTASPTSEKLSAGNRAFSFESPGITRRASQRWREGETPPQDFFSRAGSMRSALREGRRSAKRDTSNSAKSPSSVASSWLRTFSMGSSMRKDDKEDEPIRCDSEGQTIGEDYVLGKQIGYGGFSVVKEVTQLSVDGKARKLAVKIVRRQIPGKSEIENEQAQAEFEHEVELWRFLNHPHVLPLEAVYKLDEATFCFIPLNIGGTLFDLVRSNRQGLSEELCKSYAHQVAAALRYLHCDARIVHRDIKLENCLLDTTKDHPGLVRICDFGMAEWLSNDSFGSPPSPDGNSLDRPPTRNIGPADSSSSAFTGGSLEYAAPEILKLAETVRNEGNPQRSIVSPAVDIWAYGVCLYTMVVGSRPFSNAFQPRVLMSILAGDWDRQRLESKGGNHVLDLVEQCLGMDDNARINVNDVLSHEWLEDITDSDSEQERNGWKL